MTKVNSFYGAYIILKESLQFLWHNKRIVPAVWFYTGIAYFFMAIPGLTLLPFIKLINSTGALKQLFNTVPFVWEFINSLGSGGIFIGLILAAPFATVIWLFASFIPGVSKATYILSTLSAQPVSFGKSFSQGFKQCLRAWHIFVGILLLAVLLFIIPILAIKLISLMAFYQIYLALALTAIFFLFYMLLFFVKFYFWQLIADGHYSLRVVIKQSIYYLKKSWLALIATSLYISLITQVIEKLFLMLSLNVYAVLVVLMGLLFAPLWAVIINKIYLAVKEEEKLNL